MKRRNRAKEPLSNFLLSFPLASQAQRGGFFGAGVGPIFLGSLQCTGTEMNLTECVNGSTDGCTLANSAGVTCMASKLG